MCCLPWLPSMAEARVVSPPAYRPAIMKDIDRLSADVQPTRRDAWDTLRARVACHPGHLTTDKEIDGLAGDTNKDAWDLLRARVAGHPAGHLAIIEERVGLTGDIKTTYMDAWEILRAHVAGCPAGHAPGHQEITEVSLQESCKESSSLPSLPDKWSSSTGCAEESSVETADSAQSTPTSNGDGQRQRSSEEFEITLEGLRAKRDSILERQAALRAALSHLNREPEPNRGEAFQVGDIVALRKSCGVPCEFHGKIAIINDTKQAHCTVFLLSEACTHGVAELWPTYVDLEPISTLTRIGSRVLCSGIPQGPGAYLNGLMATVQEHPKDGHPQWPDMRNQQESGGGRLFVFVVPDAVEGKKRKRPMSVPLRYLQPAVAAEMEWHTNALLRIAACRPPD